MVNKNWEETINIKIIILLPFTFVCYDEPAM